MIGIVEIYKNYGTPDQELLLKENNLIVNGAGETLCDLWTTPSGAVSAVPNLVDSSNYTVQAISFGKGSDAYRTNAHFFPLHSSSYALSSQDNELKYFSYVNLVKSDNIIRAVSEREKNIGYTISSYDPKCDVGATPNVTDKALEPNTETAIDVVVGETHLMGNNYMQGRAHPYGHNLNRIVSNTNPNLLSYTTNPTSAVWTLGTNVSSFTSLAESTGPFWGTSALRVSGGGTGSVTVRQDVSGGLAGRYPAVYPEYSTSSYAFQKRYFCANTDHTFSLYIKLSNNLDERPDSVILNIKEDTGDSTGSNHKVTFAVSGGTADTPAYLSYQAYLDQNATGGVEILGVGGESTQVGWQRVWCIAEGLGAATAGASMRCMLTLPGGGGSTWYGDTYNFQLEESFGPTQSRSVSSVSPSFEEGGLDGDQFLGCYPATSGTKFAIVSSLPELNYYHPSAIVQASGIYPRTTTEHFFNLSSLRSMDQNGFVKSYNSILGEAGGPTPFASGVVVSSNEVWTEGEVSCICTISSGDLGLGNMYGGIFKCGLWTIDIENTLKGKHPHLDIKHPQVPPFTFKAGSNRLVYRLFAEKSFTYNLARIKDDGTDAGCFNYDPLTLIWRLKFI